MKRYGITVGDNIKLNVRLVDCVGYLVNNAIGYLEDDMPRMVKTPWSTEEIPFEQAAEIGTKKVIQEHSTIGILVTTDGSVTGIEREDYIEPEERVVRELKELNKNCTFISGLIDTLESQIATANSMIELLQSRNQMDQDKNSLKQEFDSVKDRIKTVKEKVDSLNTIKNSITIIEDNLSPINDTINGLNYSLSSIVDYQREYADSADRYDKISFIRNACNPGNGLGIQSEYIKRYMNDVIIDCNQMLGYMFNGSIRLEVPVINEKQFSIPFIGPNGIVVPDISNGSTAQKCMIGLVFSCVAMMKSSTTYNIPRFDEIDGGLDQQNRVMFINVLNSILNFMGSEQCIICSHNMEFDTQSTTRIICSHTGIRIEQ